MVLDPDYADDMAIMDNSTDGHYYSSAGLRINVKKTECMAVCASASQCPYHKKECIELEVGGEQVSNFIYLGANISDDGIINRELDVKIQRANGAFNQLWKT